MGTNWKESDVQCPYFVRLDKRKIICEGIIPDTVIENAFVSLYERSKHLNGWCCNSYKCCEIKQALDKKYDD